MNPAVRIRKVEETDLMRIFGFYFDLFRKSYRGVSQEGLRRLMDTQRERVERAVKARTGYVAEVAGNPVGCAFFDYEADRVYLEQLYVMRHFRRLGLGKELLKSVARASACRGQPITLFLPTDNEEYTHAKKFYESQGFNIIPDSHKRKMILPREHVSALC